jgi:hypothetical protein
MLGAPLLHLVVRHRHTLVTTITTFLILSSTVPTQHEEVSVTSTVLEGVLALQALVELHRQALMEEQP